MNSNSPAQAIARRLSAFGTSSAFATRFTVEADPQLHVEGIGKISLPVTLHTAHRLCAAAQPAHHGYKDQTRLDPRVRDTWEIPAGSLRLAAPEWTTVLDRALLRIGRDLGLPPHASLHAELHNLLIYAPGQFFTTHQDSEKADGMLGTLVITLPSHFTGGEFVISHQDQALRTRGSQARLGMVAFYADCHHEVRPVKQGYRVVLTYNLIAQRAASTAELPARAVAALAAEVRRFWQTPAAPRWDGDADREPPDRLVYLLDHQYTPGGLSWGRLKGADTERVAALHEVAGQLDAEIFLALADVHETWSAEDDYQQNGYWDDAREDEEESANDEEDHALGELLNSEVELRHWLAPDDSTREETSFATGAELCMNRLSADCAPFQSEYEGYMGNYGNTVDRWYHRAAVVMWPREHNFVIRARQAPRWAIEQIAGRLEAGDAAQALTWAQRLLPFWDYTARTAGDEALFGATLPVAAALHDADTAAGLLTPFELSLLTPKIAPWLPRLLERHGLAWCVKRLQQWANPHQPDRLQLDWMAQVLPALVQAPGMTADAAALFAGLAQQRWDWLCRHIDQVRAHSGGSAKVAALVATSGALLGLIRASRSAGSPLVAEQAIAMLRSDALPLQMPLEVLRLAGKKQKAADLGLAALHGYCAQALDARLALPERGHDDWSIAPPTDDARLDDTAEPLRRFLASPQQRRLEWPLAQAKRDTIERFIDHHELPVRHETRRSGRPYTLVLEKTPALFKRDAAERQQCEKDLAWLRRMAGRFA